MLLFLFILLLIAAAFGVLGAVIKAAVVMVLAVVLAALILAFGTFYYVRYRLRRFVRDMDERGRREHGYPTRGYKGRQLPPE